MQPKLCEERIEERALLLLLFDDIIVGKEIDFPYRLVWVFKLVFLGGSSFADFAPSRDNWIEFKFKLFAQLFAKLFAHK
jgi:hypothetical protein